MKKLKSIILSAITLTLTSFAISSCEDVNDWDVDNSYDRLFSVTRGSVSSNATDAELTWTGNSEIEYYIIEVSKEPLDNSIAMGSSSSSIVFGEDKSIKKSPYTMTGLDSSTQYYLRMKGLSSTKESNWSYYGDVYFTTKSEQIMNSVSSANILAKEVKVTWIAGAAVTHIEVTRTKDNEVVKTINLTADDIAAGELTIDDLDPETTYRINLYNNDVIRGYATVTTTPEVPEADKIIFLTTNDILNQDFFDALASETAETFTIVLPGDSEYYSEENIALPDNKSFTFFGLPGEKKATWGITTLYFASKHESIKFENLNISSTIVKSDGTQTESSYIFNQVDATEVSLLEFKDCTIGQFKNSPIRTQGDALQMITNIVIDNCIISTNGPSNGYGIIHLDKGGRNENITLKNSTIWRESKYVIYMAKFDSKTLVIQDCTFSKVSKASQYFIDYGGTANGPTDSFVIQNCIFGSTADATVKGIRSKTTPVISNCYATSDWVTGGNHISGLTSYSGGESDLFVDPSAGDFTIKDGLFSGKRSCGDPRWYMPE